MKNKIDLDEVELILPIEKPEESSQKSTLESTQKSEQKSSQKSSQKSTQKILELIREKPEITTSEMAEIIGIPRRSIAKNIKKLKLDGIIRRIGPDKGGHWEVVGE